MKIFLVEIETGIRIRDWVEHALYCDSTLGADETSIDCAASSGVFSRTLDSTELLVIGVKANGESLTKVATAALVITTPLSFHMDFATRVLTVHAPDDENDQDATVFVALVLEPLSYGKSVVKTRDGVDIFYDGRVKSLPSITQSFNTDELGGGSVPAYGNLVIDNSDRRYDQLIGSRAFMGQDVRIYRGDHEDDYNDFILHAAALIEEPAISTANLLLSLSSIGRRLDAPLLETVFSPTVYSNLDPRIVGLPIPAVWGDASRAQAFRIASGRWKIAGHAVEEITAAYDKNGAGVTILTTDLENAEFTCSVSKDGEDRLYVDCRGYDTDFVGETMEHLLLLKNFDDAVIDSAGLDFADGLRAVRVGFQALGGTISDALTLIAQSGFMDWRVTRAGVFTLVVKKRDVGNICHNSGFEVNADHWDDGDGGTVTRTIAERFRGIAAGQIVKPAGSPTAYGAATGVQFEDGKVYTVTLMAACSVGATTAFRLAIRSTTGDEVLSDSFTLTTDYTRITQTFPGLDGIVVLCDSITTFTNNNVILCDAEGGTLRLYPQYNGGSDVTVIIDDIEIVETIAINDTDTEFEGAAPHGPILWRIRMPYDYDGRLGLSLFREADSDEPRRLYPISESRALNAEGKALKIPVLSAVTEGAGVSALRDAEDAQTVADAIYDYFNAPRMRTQISRHVVDDVIEATDTLTNNLTRRPTTPGDNRLYRVVAMTEEYPEGGKPMYRITAESTFDPVYKIESRSIA